MQISLRGTVNTGIDALDFAITDMAVLQSGNGLSVFATSGPNGGISSFAMSQQGVAQSMDHALFNPAWSLGTAPDLALLADGYGGATALFGATSGDALGGYAISADGSIGQLSEFHGFSGAADGIDAMAITEQGQLLAAGGSPGFTSYDIDNSSISAGSPVDTGAESLLASVSAFAELDVAGAHVIIAASPTEYGITSFTFDGTNTTFADVSGPDQGVGIMSPTELASAEVDSVDYVIVASAMGANGALSVFSVASDGSLTATDHVLDTLDTRFGGVTSMSTAEYGGVTWLLAGGGDDGVSLFALLPGGQLQLFDTVIDTPELTLENVSAMAGGALGESLRFLVGSQSEGALTDLAVDMSSFGTQKIANASGETLAGATKDDILVGGSGNDDLNGRAGNDVLVDGAGSDRLTGGNGRDVFVLRDDGSDDTITDFNPTLDRLDLASWPMFHDPGSLEIATTDYGALITWRDETLFLYSANGAPLNADAIRAAVIQGINRPLDLSDFTPPPDNAHDIIGTDGDDILRGGPESETFDPGLGNDTIYAGDGDDVVLEGSGTNLIYLEEGNDVYRVSESGANNGGDQVFGGGGADDITTGSGSDRVDGGSGNDTIRSGAGNDLVTGGTGVDTVYLEAGDDEYNGSPSGGGTGDEVHGGDGNDTINGGDGQDTLLGDMGRDFIHGNDGDDTLNGGGWSDVLFGDGGNDHLIGEWGNDELHGGSGNDLLEGKQMDDTLFGEDGDDRLYGGDDDDQLDGGDGADLLMGEGGNDILIGKIGDDILDGGDGDDILKAGAGNDTLTGGDGRDKLLGRGGNDTLISGGGKGNKLLGNKGDDSLLGDAERDVLKGGFGSDIITGGGGNDRLIGGRGADEFFFIGDTGKDRIRDFNPRVDSLHIDDARASDISLHEKKAGLWVHWAHNQVLLVGLDHTDFHVSMIDFG